MPISIRGGAGKFLVIKAVVFFSFWQSLLISLLQYLHVIQGSEDVTDPGVSSSCRLLAAYIFVCIFSRIL